MTEFDRAISDALDDRSSDATTTDPDPTQPTGGGGGPPEDDGPNPGGRFGPPEDDEPANRVTTPDPDPTQPRTITESVGIPSSVGSDATTVNPDPTAPTAGTKATTFDDVRQATAPDLGAEVDVESEPVSIAGDGPIASIDVPGTDTDVGGALDAGARGFEERVTDPVAEAAAATNRQDSPFMTGSPERAQLAEDFTRGAVGAANIPGAAAIGVRVADEVARQTEPSFAGGPIGFTGDPERTERTAEVTREAGSEAAEFAAENPGRASAFVAGGALGGLGAGAASRAGVRGVTAAGRNAGRVGRSIDAPSSSTLRRIRRDVDDLEVETTTDPDAGRVEIDGTPASDAVTDAIGRANNPGSTASSRGVFGRPTGTDSGNTPVSQQVDDALDQPATINLERSRRTFGRPTGTDTGNVPVSQQVDDILDDLGQPETIDLQRSRRTFGRPTGADSGNRPLSDVLGDANDPGDLTGSRGTFGRPAAQDVGERGLSSRALERFRDANDPGDLTTSRGVFGRPTAADTGADGVLGGPTTLDARRSRAAFGRPTPSDAGETPLSTRAIDANDPGDLTTSRGTFGRPAAQDVGERGLSERLLESFRAANDPDDLTTSRGVFGRPTADDAGGFGFGDLAEVRGVRINTGRGAGRTVDVEDLDGPDPAEGAPVVRNRPFDADPDAGGTRPAGGQLDTTVDVGDGQVARVRQRVGGARRADPDGQGRQAGGRGAFGLGVGAGGLGGLGGGALDPSVGDGTGEAGGGLDPIRDPTTGDATEGGLGTGTGTDTGAETTVDTETGQIPGLGIRAETRVGSIQRSDQITALETGLTTDLQEATRGDLTQRQRITVDTFGFRGRRIPDGPDVESDEDPLRIDEDADDRRFSSGIQSGDELADAILGDGTDRGAFAIDEDDFIGR